MAASVVTSISSNALYSAFNKNNKDVQNSLQKVGTGYRVNSAKDDAASSAIASSLTSELGSMEKAHLNTSQAMSMLKSMESGIDQITSMVQRIEALTVQAQSSSLSQKNKATLQGEVSGLLGQIGKIVNTSHFNGVPILNGQTTTTAYNPFFSLPSGGTLDGSGTIPTSNVFPAGLSYSFDNSVQPTAVEIYYEAASEGCNAGTLYMTNLETGATQQMVVSAPIVGTNSYYFDQLGASIELTTDFAATTFSYGLNTASTNKILANTSGDINCMGLTTENNNIAITATHGMISDLASTTVAISGTNAKAATFTLAGASYHTGSGSGLVEHTNGNFVANNIDLSTTGVKNITLTRTRNVNSGPMDSATGKNIAGSSSKQETDSITMQINVVTAFTTSDLTGESAATITLAQLQNIVIADSETANGGTLNFQVGTNAVGADSDNQFSANIPSVSVASLGLSGVDLTQPSSQISSSLHMIRNALSNLNTQKANVGVAQSQIEILQGNLEVSMENSTAARSSLIDLDFAKGVLDLTNATVRAQASQQALQRSNGLQNQLIQLLQG